MSAKLNKASGFTRIIEENQFPDKKTRNIGFFLFLSSFKKTLYFAFLFDIKILRLNLFYYVLIE